MKCVCIVLIALGLFGQLRLVGHPATLGDYPERIPGKTLQQIKDEWESPPTDASSEADLSALARKIVQKWTAMSSAERKTEIDKLGSENRRGDYRKRFANLANDMLDVQPDAEAQETADYLAWRLDHLADDDGFFEELARGSWDEKPEEKDQRTREWEDARRHEIWDLSARADTASAALRPHWLVQCGAHEFKHRRHAEAAGFFQRVIEAFPQHPRSEVAMLMLARIAFDQWRQEKRSYHHDEAKLVRLQDAWWAAVKRYRDRYPNGRFGIDLLGWEAGYSLENGHLGQALRDFMLQGSDPDHPEVRRRAFQQIEWMLDRLIGAPDEIQTLPWDEVASEPLVALRLGYFMLDCRSDADLGAIMHRRSGEDHRVLESLGPDLAGVRRAAFKAWPLLDAALAKNETAYAGEKAVIRRTLHAWSNVVRHQPGVALGMLGEDRTGPAADDAALAYVFALIKTTKYAEAVRAIETFQQTHAESPLNRGMTIRMADAWVELGQTGTAISILWDMLAGKDIAQRRAEIESDPALHLSGEAAQRFSALLTFAPLDQLKSATEGAMDRPQLRAALCAALRIRHLVAGNFEECLRWSAESDFEHWQPLHGAYDKSVPKLREEWLDGVSAIQAATTAAKSDAADWIALGKQWRGLLLKLLTGGVVYVPGTYEPAVCPAPSHELRSHAAYIHVSDTTAAAMLDDRQELTQARRCFEMALKLAPDRSDTALEARTLLNDVLRQRAEVSPYFRDRAVELQDARLSRELAAKIPNGVFWTIQPAATLGEWEPGDSALWRVEVEIAERLGCVSTVNAEDQWQREAALKRLGERLKQTVVDGASADELKAIRDAVEREAPVLKSASLLNHLDDLILLLAQPDVGPETFTAYANLRLAGEIMPLDDPALASVKDFASFWNAVITPSVRNREQEGWRQQSAQAQVERMTQFLADYPKSAKREAALARLAINTLRQSRCHCGLAYGDPFRNASTSYACFVAERGIPFDHKVVLDRITDYEREFPNGRYQAEMRLTRGLAAAEAHDWKTALSELIAILNDPGEQDLHLDASNTLCAIFMDLHEGAHRSELKAAIEKVPGSSEKLIAFMQSSSCGWRLRIMEEWIRSWAKS